MRAAEWKRLTRVALRDTGVDWSWATTLAYIRPASWNVHGILAEASANRPREFYIWVVQMPLTVPLGGVVDLSWSSRFGVASTTYAADSSAARSAISGAADAAIANERAQELLLAPPGGTDNIRLQEARAYGLLLADEDAIALEVLRRVGRYDATYPWEKELLERAATMAALIESGRRDEAAAWLRRWRVGNCESIGLTCD